MTSVELRKKFLKFFEKKGHKIVPSSSLLPTDPSVLFTTAGMQQFKSYFLGEKSPYGNKVASCQKCFRTSDIEEVGDIAHLTFLEMLGNFSFGDYFKKESIEWALELLTETCGLKKENLWITVFKGDKEVAEDKESREIWKKLGFSEERIYGFSREDNFWGPTGEEGPCGPTTEIHYDSTGKPCSLGKKCLPNCKCGRFVELWNLVFNEFYQDRDKKLTPLKQKGVDTGMGLERLAVVVQKKPSVFETDLFSLIPQSRAERIIADHIKGSVFLASEGIIPSNVEQGYILRRILRRAIRYGKILKMPKNFLIPLAQKVIEIYKEVYPEVKSNEADILTVIQNEEEKFEKTLERGLRKLEKLISKNKDISGEEAFDLYQSYGFPLELTEELAEEKGFKVDKTGFEKAIEKHQEISRAGREKKFGGVGKEAGLEATKLHTATHLLHQALRQVLGEHIKQMGSDVTSQRLRFDFSHSAKMTEEEVKKVEEIVNQKIKQDLEVKKEEMSYKEAIKSGALAFFKEKYPERVSIYSINKFSKEICAGPHVKRTSELGKFKIIKEESSGSGIRRIKAILE
ncbi:alanine--tRNA ligase [Patescibacteria group bacterium]|nr:alanine--tRNA ligase [Patescibacteria group bacterium]